MGKKKVAQPKPTRSVKGRIALAAFVVVAAAVAAFFWYRSGTDAAVDLGQLVQPGDAAGFNLLLVTLDTVRSDRLGCYGYARAETPTVDALAARGVQFDAAVTPTPLTLPSHATMLTGLSPPRHGVRDNGTFHLAPRYVTLAETLKDRGYDTAAFIGCFVLDERFGLNQGFDTYDFEVTPDGFYLNNVNLNRRPADAVSDSAIRWLRNRHEAGAAAPFFMWVHYFDAHKPYQSPYATLPRFAGRPYDAEIAYVDTHLKRLLDELDRLDLRASTLIAVVSDHGEGLGEHDEPTHGLLLYGSTVRVAFILSNPSLFPRPIRIRDRLVSLCDLRPTLEDLLGAPVTPELDGLSLLRANADPDRAVYIETHVPFYSARCSPLYGLRRLGDKYIRAPEPEYYDLRADPGELHNLHSRRSAQVSALDARLTRVMDGWAGAGAADGQRAVSAEELQRLASLGYVHTAASGGAGELPDPKALLRADRKISAALQMRKANRLQDALRLSQEAVAECRAYTDGSELLATLYEELNRPEDAIRVLRECLALNPTCGTALQLARLLMLQKRDDEMEEALATAEGLEPGNGFVCILRGDHLVMQGRLRDAIDRYQQAVRIDEHRAGKLARPQIEKLRARLNNSP